VVVGLGTLLGPEVSLVPSMSSGVGGAADFCADSGSTLAWGSCYRPCVENFTVDASIFVVTTSY
jgi:hypothetical protein